MKVGEAIMAQRLVQMQRPALLALLAVFFASGGAARADTATECTLIKFCYCVDVGLKGVIDQQVAAVREAIGKQKAQGKAIGYMSIPISTIAGSYYGVNVKVGTEVKERVESRFGPPKRRNRLPTSLIFSELRPLLFSAIIEYCGGPTINVT